MGKKSSLISIVTTAYNEENILEETILEWDSWLNQNKLNYEIIVYNDGSIDNTLKILKKLNSSLKSFSYINGSNNRGYGYGMKKAIEKASGDYIVTIDADNQYKIKNLKNFFFIFDSSLLCVTGHRERKKDSFLKVFADRVLKIIVKNLFKTKLKDTNCALKMIHRDVIKKIKLESDDYSFPSELCLRIENENITIADVPILHSFRKQGKSAISLFFTSYKFLKFLISLKIQFLKSNR
jgi:glycosyltransferase involved in cell wall biosynthesis